MAFWGEGAIDELGLANAKRPTRVLLDLDMGGTNPDVVKALDKLSHIEVKQYPKLHSKAYMTQHEVVIGSTNASANGLGAEGSEATRWHELACLTNDKSVVQDTKRWFEHKWAAAKPISRSDLEKAEKIWAGRQRLRPKVESKIKEILAATTEKPSEFRNRGIYVVVSTEDFDKNGDADAANYQRETGRVAIAWQDWADIPKDANLICFSYSEGEGFQWDSPKVCYSPREINQYKSLVLVTKSSLDNDFKVDSIETWRLALEQAKVAISYQEWKDEEGLCMDLGDFAKKFGKNVAS